MLSRAELRSARLALRAALEPASSAAGRLRSIWRRKSPFLTLSPSRTARFTTWPCTSADISTLFSAWILPLAVTLETMSCVATRAVRTGVAWLRLRQTAAPAPNTSTPATMIQMRRLRRVKGRQATSRPHQRQTGFSDERREVAVELHVRLAPRETGAAEVFEEALGALQRVQAPARAVRVRDGGRLCSFGDGEVTEHDHLAFEVAGRAGDGDAGDGVASLRAAENACPGVVGYREADATHTDEVRTPGDAPRVGRDPDDAGMPAGGPRLAEHSVARPGFAVHTDVAADAVHAGAQVGVSLDADAVDVSLAQAGNADRIRESGHARRLARAEHTGQRVRIPGDSPQEVRPPDCLVRRRQGYTLAMSYRGR